MISKINYLLLLFLALGQTALGQGKTKDTLSVGSPDGALKLNFYRRESSGKGTMLYSVIYKNKPVVLESEIDVQLDNQLSEKAMALKVDTHAKWCENLVVTGVSETKHDSLWTPVYGERQQVRDQYNALTIKMLKADNPIYLMNLEIRVYNEGTAFRFHFPENEKGTYYRVTSENTEFSLPQGAKAWFANWAQAPYVELPIKDWPGESERPLTISLANGLYACITEAAMVDYARTKLKLSVTRPNTLITSMFGPADLISPVSTPWRVIMVAERPGDLIEHNALILNLNDPSRIREKEWIIPGKIMRVMKQTTADAKENIDFAANRGLRYILFDWKWYGPAFSFSSDATRVAIKDFDLPGIIEYGRSKGVGVWLYVNQQALLAQSDSLFHHYQRWGVKGVKFGFVQVGTHRWTTWLEKAIQQAAERKIMVNIHDDWRPTGEQRTWPNLMTAEGIRGNEEMPDATHNTILPFTRYIAGAADYTICYFDKRVKTTHAHQLALAAIYYSPIQTLFWYDTPSQYHDEPELEFWKKIPTSWDDTRVVQGFPGKYVTIARRTDENWFVGTITNNEARKLELPLSFLKKGNKYRAFLYDDDESYDSRTHVRPTQKIVTASSVLSVTLKPSGGQALYLEKISTP